MTDQQIYLALLQKTSWLWLIIPISLIALALKEMSDKQKKTLKNYIYHLFFYPFTEKYAKKGRF